MSSYPEIKQPSTLKPLRLAYYRHERKLVISYVIIAIALNAFVFLWPTLQTQLQIEQKFVSKEIAYWRNLSKKTKSLAKERKTLEAITLLEAELSSSIDMQLRERGGRVRTGLIARLVNLLNQQGEYKRARAWAGLLIEIDPKDYRGHSGLGEASNGLGDSSDAIKAFQTSLRLYPYNMRNTKSIINLFSEKADHAGVVEAFSDYYDALYVARGRFQLNEGKENNATISFPTVIDGKPHSYRLYPNQAKVTGKSQMYSSFSLKPLDANYTLIEFDEVRFRFKSSVFSKPPQDRAFPGDDNSWQASKTMQKKPDHFFYARTYSAQWTRDINSIDLNDVAEIIITMTLHKSVDSALADMVKHAYRNVPNSKAGEHLFKALPIYDAIPSTVVQNTFPQKPPQELSNQKTNDNFPSVYSIAVIGHTRKNDQDEIQIQQSLLDYLPTIQKLDSALVFTGDIIWSASTERWQQFQALISSKLTIPIHIAVGNHDLAHKKSHSAGREMFQHYFGDSYYAKQHHNSLLVLLDTELAKGDITEQQLAWLQETLSSAKTLQNIDHIFIFTHRVLWLQTKDNNIIALKTSNKSTRKAKLPSQYMESIEPLLQELAQTKRVHIISGDVGTRIPLVYQYENNITYIASGNYAAKPMWWNHLIRINIAGPDVRFDVVPLEGYPLNKLETYTIDYWQSNHPKTLNKPTTQS